MKTFVFFLKEKVRGVLTEKLLQDHVSHLKKIQATGVLVLCGPFADDNGAIQIIRSQSRVEAIAIFEHDPFIREKYYASYDVYELHEANDSNNWLMDFDQTKNNLKK